MLKRTETPRDTILQAAEERMMRYGIQKTTMHEIAQDVGLAVGTLYLHFKNKDEIVLAIADQCRQYQAEMASDILNSSLTPDEMIREFVMQRFRYVWEYHRDNPHAQEFMRRLIQLEPGCVDAWRQRVEDNIRQILEAGCEAKVFYQEDCARSAQVFFLAIRSFFPYPGDEVSQCPDEAELAVVVDWFVQTWKAGTHAPVSV
jgi:AcrR family transcriptional regulator